MNEIKMAEYITLLTLDGHTFIIPIDCVELIPKGDLLDKIKKHRNNSPESK